MSTERRPLPVTGELRSRVDVVADQLLDMYLDPRANEMQHIGSYELPSEQQVESIVEQCRALLFPGYAGPDVDRGAPSALRDIIRARLIELRLALHRQVYRAAHHKRQQSLGRSDLECTECADKADAITDRFLARLPELRRQVTLDLHAAYEGDPAASGVDEILFCYPGTYAVTVYRLAHALLREGAQVIPRMMTELAHRRTGVDLHPGAEIGASFFIDHGTGVVIGETTLIGSRVRIYQGVTLGAKSFPLDADGHPVKGVPRHPVVEDDVIIYSNATVLGRITLGKGTAIGGNVWLTRSVPAGSVITQANEKDGMP